MSDTDRSTWAERSKEWVKTAAQGRAQDDTFNQMVAAEAGIQPGEAVLDTASGTGNPGVTIALSMEGKGRVVCSDFTFRMLETARGRAENLSLDIMEFACCDMTALPFADASFDCLTCRFGLMSVEDKAAAAGEAMRVLTPGGRAVYAVWGAYEENPPFYVPRRAVAEFLGEEEGPVPGRHAMGAPGTVTNILEAAGFERAEERELRYDNEVADPGEYVERGLRRSFTKQVEPLDEDRFSALKSSVLKAWEPFTRDGVLCVPNYARLGIGWKPR